MPRYFKKLVGDSVYLSPLNPDDAETFTVWVNDPEIGAYTMFATKIISMDSERAALSSMADGGYNFAIVRTADDTLLGVVSFMGINHINPPPNSVCLSETRKTAQRATVPPPFVCCSTSALTR
jgi:RimJ/RimL family protein N-acetyltransferase